VNEEGSVDIRRFYCKGAYDGFAKSKATLLIFRKVELRVNGIEKC